MVHSSAQSDRLVLQKRKQRRLALLIDGTIEIFRHKSAMGLLRYCPEDIVCVIQPDHENADLSELVGVGHGIPVVGSVDEALSMEPDFLVIGISTPGGYLPPSIREQVYLAIRARLGVISGLHEGLSTDPNIASLACRHAVELIDLRKGLGDDYSRIASGKARESNAFRVLTVGTDCNLGKMTTALSLELFLRNKLHVRARFVATGQNGKLIKGRGVCIDRVISDFASGAVEELILDESEYMDMLLIEGQGALLSPPFSGVSMSLLHGSCPDAMILCHRTGRDIHRNSDVAIPSLNAYKELYENILAPLHPGKVVGISLNTMGLSTEEANLEIERVAEAIKLPVADVIRQGSAGRKVLAQAILDHAASLGHPVRPDPEWHRNPEIAADPIGLKKHDE